VHANVGSIRALVPFYTIHPPQAVHPGDDRSRFDAQERSRDGIVYVGYESHRVKGEYLRSGKMMQKISAPGTLIDIRV